MSATAALTLFWGFYEAKLWGRQTSEYSYEKDFSGSDTELTYIVSKKNLGWVFD